MIWNRTNSPGVGLDAALDALSPKVKRALFSAHERLASIGVAHVLVGGIATGAYGYPHATKDVDWLVVEEEAFSGALIVTFKPGVPIQVEDVGVDYLTPEGPEIVVARMREALEASSRDLNQIVVVDPSLLVWMKLKAGRPKDTTAVVEMLGSGVVQDWEVRGFLEQAGDPVVMSRFLHCMDLARVDE